MYRSYANLKIVYDIAILGVQNLFPTSILISNFKSYSSFSKQEAMWEFDVEMSIKSCSRHPKHFPVKIYA